MNSKNNYRGLILILIGLTATLVVAMPTMAVPVLFSEIAEDLDLSLVQVGTVWGIGSLPGLVTGLFIGVIADRFGSQRVLVLSCIALGVVGASRGFSNSFLFLAITTVLGGFLSSVIPTTLHITCGLWFSGKRLGLANGFVSAGMATGFMAGSMLSATILSPWLGSWRQVMFFYGVIGGLMSIPWMLMPSPPGASNASMVGGNFTNMRAGFSHVVSIRDVWLLGVVLLGVSGCVQSTLGYLPLYLREIGWNPSRADAALSSFHASSLSAVFPITTLSDRLRSRKIFLMLAAFMIAAGVGSLGIVNGGFVWVAVLTAGIVRDGFMALIVTMITELEGVRSKYAGTAIGLCFSLSRLGGLLAPPLGNSLASMNLRFPFLFWSSMAVVSFIILIMIREKRTSP